MSCSCYTSHVDRRRNYQMNYIPQRLRGPPCHYLHILEILHLRPYNHVGPIESIPIHVKIRETLQRIQGFLNQAPILPYFAFANQMAKASAPVFRLGLKNYLSRKTLTEQHEAQRRLSTKSSYNAKACFIDGNVTAAWVALDRPKSTGP